MEQLFQDQTKQETLDKEGVVVVDLLQAEELKALQDFYQELHPDGIPPQMRDGIHMTIWCSDKDYKVKVREGLKSVLDAALKRQFQDFRLVSPVFIVKRQGKETTFPIHQDWNVVDESRHRAFNLWIPLHDVDETNGALWIVKGSHRLPTVVRGAGFLFPNLYGLEEHLRPQMEAMCIKAGQALVFYHRVIHGSPPNQSPEPRVVTSGSILPNGVPMHIYFQKDAKSPLEVYHPQDNFIYEFDNVRDDTAFKAPEGEPVEVRSPYPGVKLEPKDFHVLMGEKRPWWKRLFGK